MQLTVINLIETCHIPCLHGNQGLLLRLGRLDVGLRDRWVDFLRGSREIGGVDLMAAIAVEQRLRLGSVVAYNLLSDLCGLLGVLLRNGAELSSLSIDNVTSMLQLPVNKLLVRGVDERRKEDDSRSNQRETPVRNDLDQVVRQKGTQGRLERVSPETKTLGLTELLLIG